MLYAVPLLTVLAFGFTKLSVLFFYKRVFRGKVLDGCLWTMWALIFVWVVGFFFAEMLQCIPFSVNFRDYGNVRGQCFDVNRMMLAQAWSDVVTNITILALPIPIVSLHAA